MGSCRNERDDNVLQQISLLGAVWLRSQRLRSVSQIDPMLLCKEPFRKLGGIVWLTTAISSLHLLHLAGGELELRGLLLAHFEACISPSADLPFFFFLCLPSFAEGTPQDSPASKLPWSSSQ